MQTPNPPAEQSDKTSKTVDDPAQPKPQDAPAGNESNNPLGDPNDVGTAGDYSR